MTQEMTEQLNQIND